jgi:hypothetical protein
MATNVDEREKKKEIFSIRRLKENYIIAPTIDLRRFLFSFQIRFLHFRVDCAHNFTFFRASKGARDGERMKFEVHRDHAFLPQTIREKSASKLWPIKLPIHNLDEQQKRDF